MEGTLKTSENGWQMAEQHLRCSSGVPGPTWVSVSARGAFIQHNTVLQITHFLIKYCDAYSMSTNVYLFLRMMCDIQTRTPDCDTNILWNYYCICQHLGFRFHIYIPQPRVPDAIPADCPLPDDPAAETLRYEFPTLFMYLAVMQNGHKNARSSWLRKWSFSNSQWFPLKKGMGKILLIFELYSLCQLL